MDIFRYFLYPLQRVHVVLAGIVGVGVAVAYLFTKHWILNNIIGICFALSGVEYLGLSSFKVGAILLVWRTYLAITCNAMHF